MDSVMCSGVFESAVRAAQTRLDRHAAPDAASWEANADITIDDLAQILRTVPRRREFASLGRFVDGVIARIHARQVTDTQVQVWCPQWWEHAEALWRFDLLWRGFERARAAGSDDEMDHWTLHRLEPHMRVLLDPAGPFKYCGVRNGHKDYLAPLPSAVDKAPPGLFADHPAQIARAA